MRARLWFWSRERPRPHVIDEGIGKSLMAIASGCFVPVTDRAWARESRDGKLIWRRGDAGYCCERIAEREPESKRPARQRERLGSGKRVRERL